MPHCTFIGLAALGNNRITAFLELQANWTKADYNTRVLLQENVRQTEMTQELYTQRLAFNRHSMYELGPTFPERERTNQQR